MTQRKPFVNRPMGWHDVLRKGMKQPPSEPKDPAKALVEDEPKREERAPLQGIMEQCERLDQITDDFLRGVPSSNGG